MSILVQDSRGSLVSPGILNTIVIAIRLMEWCTTRVLVVAQGT